MIMSFDLTAHLLLPVATLSSIDDALWLVDVLGEAGISIIEITNRASNAFDIAKILVKERSDVTVGMGTITSQSDLSKALDCGAKFCVSPGLLSFLPQQADIYNMPFLAGIQTVSEAMKARALGIKHVKVFPAQLMGGPSYLKALSQVLPDMSFCPSGGVNLESLTDYFSIPQVKQVASSELANQKLVEARDKLTLIDIINAYRQKIMHMSCETF